MFLAINHLDFYNKASDEQKQAASQNQAFTSQLENQFKTEFNDSQGIQAALNKQLQSIVNQGLAGQGYTNGEEAALRSDATERAAQASQQAEQASAAQDAARSEGGALTSGAVAQGDEDRTAISAAQDAAAQRAITEQNANLARENVARGETGLEGLSGQEASEAGNLAGVASSNAANSYNEVTQAFQPSNFWSNLASGVIGGIGNIVAPGVGTMLSQGLSKAFDGSTNTPLQTSQPIVQTEIPEEPIYDPYKY